MKTLLLTFIFLFSANTFASHGGLDSNLTMDCSFSLPIPAGYINPISNITVTPILNSNQQHVADTYFIEWFDKTAPSETVTQNLKDGPVVKLKLLSIQLNFKRVAQDGDFAVADYEVSFITQHHVYKQLLACSN
jgi:hypothetical protein